MNELNLKYQGFLNQQNSSHLFSHNVKLLIKYFIALISVSLFFWNLVTGFSSYSIQLTAWLVLLISIFLIIYTRKNILLFIIYTIIAYCNYSIVMIDYIHVLDNSYFTSFSNDIVSDIGLNIMLLFMVSLTVFTPIKIKTLGDDKNLFLSRNLNNSYISLYGIVVILLYILIFQFHRPDSFGVRGTPSPLYEYSIIFFIVGFYFTGLNRTFKYILTFLLTLFVFQNLFYGGRVISIQLLLVFYIMFYSQKIKLHKLLPILIIGFVFMSMIGEARASLEVSLSSINHVLNDLMNRMLSLDTSYSAYFTSLTFLKVEGFTSIYTRFQLFIQFILSLFIPGHVNNGSLPVYTSKFYTHYGGGVFPFYFKFYLGWLGVCLCPLLIFIYTRVINNLKFRSNGLIACLSVYIASTVFRWYLYSPIMILKGVVLLAITYYIGEFIHRLK